MRNQEGVTLVVAVVLLAAVTFVSFSISTVIVREIGSARLVLRTEPAISGANSGGEIGLFRLLRETGGSSASGSTPQSGASYQVTSNLYDDPYEFSITDGAKIRIGLFDAETTTKQTNNYQSVMVTSTANNPFKVAVYSWNDTKNSYCAKQTISQNGQYSCGLNAVDDRYIIEIEPSGNNAAGQISATRDNGSRGVPSDSPEMDVLGQSGNVQRKIKIDLEPQ